MSKAGGDPGLVPTAVAVPPQANLIVVAGVLLSAAVLVLVSFTLWQSRADTWANAARSSENLVEVIANDIARNFDLYDLVLQDLTDDLFDPGVDRTPAVQHRFLSRALETSAHIESILLLDAAGDVVADSASPEPRSGNFSDRDYFRAQREQAGLGSFMSHPYESGLRGGDPSVAISRRIDGPNGDFAGVLVVAVSLRYLQDLFEKIDVGSGGTLVLVRSDGFVVIRQPSTDGKGDVGRDVSRSPNFFKTAEAPSGSFSGTAQIDLVDRFYTYTRVPGFPLIMTVARSTDEIFSDWWRRSMVIGGLTVAICLAAIVLVIGLRREIIRRARVEADLAFLSITDGLTGLANRRRFDEMFAREWRRTKRTGASLALLMIDADRFKQLNDRFGHARGDEVLKAIARAIDSSIRRPGDIAARYGGEEFAAILPNTDAGDARAIAEEIRSRVEKEARAKDDDPIDVTISVGVAATIPDDDTSAEDLVKAADKALYRAKHSGRNRVEVEAVALPA